MLDWLSLSLGLMLGLLCGGICIFLLLFRRIQSQQARILELTQTEAKHQLLEQQLKQQNEHFENIAHKILDRNTEKLTSENQQHLQHLLQPLKERISTFEQKVEHTYHQESRERFNLQKQIEQLASLNMQMSEEARNLTRALKGDNKAQGNWGELVLTRVLESSGLREGEEFVIQGKDLALSQNGKRLQPDVIIQLPGEKHLIIDSKVSLTAYERYLELESEFQPAALKQHIQSVTNHINQLSDKHYPGINQLNTPDFVLLFMPLEPSFSLALQHKSDLFTFAWEKRIVLVSPTTLLATLRTVASLWQLEHQNAHAQEIARQGGALYDKFALFIEEMNKIGATLNRAAEAHTDAMNKLKNGKGNLMGRAEKLRELGAKTRKQLKL